MRAKLYWFPMSHPSQAVRKMLELKGIPFDLVNVSRATSRSTCGLPGSGAGPFPR